MDSLVLDLYVIRQSQKIAYFAKKKLTITAHAKRKTLLQSTMLASVAVGAINDTVAIAGTLISSVVLL